MLRPAPSFSLTKIHEVNRLFVHMELDIADFTPALADSGAGFSPSWISSHTVADEDTARR
jgi:hypothetical protein